MPELVEKPKLTPKKNPAGIALISIILTLFASEFALRLMGLPDHNSLLHETVYGRQYLLDCYPSNPRGDFDIDLGNDGTRRYWEQLVDQSLESIRLRTPFAVSSHYNELGLRGKKIESEKRKHSRVVILGDSFTEGQGVREAFTYPVLLEQLLEKQNPGKFEVVNAGRRGTDFPDLYRNFIFFNSLNPDVVLYAMVLNDPEQVPEFQDRQKYLNDLILDRHANQEETRLLFRGLNLAALLHDVLEARRLERETIHWYLDMYGKPNRIGWEHTKELIGQMAEISRKNGRRFAIVLWPLFIKLDGDYPFETIHQKIRSFAKDSNIPLLDLLTVFKGQKAETLWVHAGDMHPNQEAHRQAALAIFSFLQTIPD